MHRGAGLIGIAAVLAGLMLATMALAKKKNPDDFTQTLALPKDPPAAAVGETARLVFHVSPLSANGLLSQQTRDALKAILRLNGNSPVVHIRAFVAGSGDLRRVPQIVSEVFAAKKMALPSVSVVQAGGLALTGAQVEIEAISLAKKVVNPDGLTFGPMEAEVTVTAPVAITCFADDRLTELTAEMARKFPSAAVTVVQPRREGHIETRCEAIGRGGSAKSTELAFTGTRVAFGVDEKATATVVDRLVRDLAGVNAPAMTLMSVYAPGQTPKLAPPQGSLSVVPVEGVAPSDARFAIDAVAAVSR